MKKTTSFLLTSLLGISFSLQAIPMERNIGEPADQQRPVLDRRENGEDPADSGSASSEFVRGTAGVGIAENPTAPEDGGSNRIDERQSAVVNDNVPTIGQFKDILAHLDPNSLSQKVENALQDIARLKTTFEEIQQDKAALSVLSDSKLEQRNDLENQVRNDYDHWTREYAIHVNFFDKNLQHLSEAQQEQLADFIAASQKAYQLAKAILQDLALHNTMHSTMSVSAMASHDKPMQMDAFFDDESYITKTREPIDGLIDKASKPLTCDDFIKSTKTYPSAARLIIQNGTIQPQHALGNSIDRIENRQVLRKLKDAIIASHSSEIAEGIFQLNAMALLRADDLSTSKLKRIVELDNSLDYGNINKPRLLGGGGNHSIPSSLEICDRYRYYTDREIETCGEFMQKKQSSCWKKAADFSYYSACYTAYHHAFLSKHQEAVRKNQTYVARFWKDAADLAKKAATHAESAARQYEITAGIAILFSENNEDAERCMTIARNYWQDSVYKAREAAEKTQHINPEEIRRREAENNQAIRAPGGMDRIRTGLFGAIIATFIPPIGAIVGGMMVLDAVRGGPGPGRAPLQYLPNPPDLPRPTSRSGITMTGLIERAQSKLNSTYPIELVTAQHP